jgi:hypothetical protein
MHSGASDFPVHDEAGLRRSVISATAIGHSHVPPCTPARGLRHALVSRVLSAAPPSHLQSGMYLVLHHGSFTDPGHLSCMAVEHHSFA